MGVGKRVFLSHTSDLRGYPEPHSFVSAAEDAITRSGHVPVDMEYFAAGDVVPAEHCRTSVLGSDVYVGVIGFRYGSLVPGAADVSYTEFEFNAATAAGIPRLLFLLDDGTPVPASLIDANRDRQEDFRSRLRKSGLLIKKFRTRDSLELAVYQALQELPPAGGRGRGAGPTAGVPSAWTAPSPWGLVVPRPDLMSELVHLLTQSSVRHIGLTTALRGAGGFGKTTLAAEACRRPEVRERFPGGIFWVTVGEETAGADLATKVNDLSEVIGGQRPTLSDPEQAGYKLGELFGDAERLLVIDDVWRRSQLRVFLQGGPGCVRLITTRMGGLLPGDAECIEVDAMGYGEAHELLTASLSGLPDSLTSSLLRQTGRWPVLLSLVNSTIRRMVRGGATPAVAADRVRARLNALGPTALDVSRPEQRDEAVAATVEASLGILRDDQLQRYLELAIFPEDVLITRDVLETLWGATGSLDAFAVEALCEEFLDLSLVQSYRQSPPGLRLHDVIRTYLRTRSGPERIIEVNRVLLDAARTALGSSAAWWTLPAAAEYLWRNLGLHLNAAARTGELVELIQDLRWVAAKLERFGPVAVDADLALLDGDVATELRRAVARAAHLFTPITPAKAMSSLLLSRLDGVIGVRSVVAPFMDLLERPRLVNAWPLPDQPHRALRRILLRDSGRILALAASPDGRWLAGGGEDRLVRVWDVETGATRHLLEGHSGPVWACAVGPDGRWLASAGEDRTVRIWDVETGETRAVLSGHTGRVRACAVGPDGRWLASAGDDRTVRIWDVETGETRAVLSGHTGRVWACAFGPGGDWLATAAEDRAGVRLWDLAKRRPRASLDSYSGPVLACGLGPDGRWLASGGDEGAVQIWDLATQQVRTVLEGHAGRVRACAASTAGGWFASSGDDQIVQTWEVAISDDSAVARHRAPGYACSTSAGGRWLASAGSDRVIRLRDVDSSQVRAELVVRGAPFWALAASHRGDWVAMAGNDGAVRMLAPADASVRLTLRGHRGPVWGCSVAPDDSFIATCGEDRTIRTWATESGACTAELIGHADRVRACAIGPDGRWLVSASGDQTARLWDLATRTTQRSLIGHSGALWACTVSPDGSWVGTGGDDMDLRIWDTDTGVTRAVLVGHTGRIRGCAASHDGRWLASVGADRTIRIWDAVTADCVAAMRVETVLAGCCWLPDSLDICAVGDGGTYLFSYQP